ncbi:MAG: LysR family transcriptional regulator [bacterium]|nr:LysR family transcriptional regulator [bacterium]
MELYQLRTFVTVAEHGNLTQAAEVLHLSQPAVTAQIKALEEEFGLALFERIAVGVSLTRAGGELIEEARSLLNGARQLREMAQRLAGETRSRLRIGILLTPGLLRLGPLCQTLHEHHPLLDLQLRPGLSGDILNLVRKKELDAGFFIGRHPYSNVTGWPLAKLHYRVIAPPSWQEKIIKGDVKCLGRLPWIGTLPFSAQHALQQEFWRKHNLRPKSVLEAGQEEDFLELVSAGLGLALARESTACAMAAAGKVLVVEDAVLETELSLITASESADSRLIQELHAAVIAAWQ